MKKTNIEKTPGWKEEIIMDIITVMKYYDIERIKIRVPEKWLQEDFSVIDIPVRLKNAIIRNNKLPGAKSKNYPRIHTISDLMDGIDSGYLRTWEAIGARAIADAKHAIIVWFIEENIRHERLPLAGIQLI